MPAIEFREKRRSDRIALSLPIRVRTSDSVDEHTKTAEVSGHGVKFGLKATLRSNQKIHILNVRRDVEAPFRVVGQVPGPAPNGTFWGAECLEPCPRFWGIYFPPREEGQEAAARVVLACTNCESRELCYLSDLETEVLGSTQRVSRQCNACVDWTEWFRADPAVQTEARAPATTVAGRERSTEGRRHRRITLAMPACLRTREGEEEVLKTANISRGGLAVRSKKHYLKGCLLKIAFPYHAGGSNVFVLGQVVRTSTTEEPGVLLYGIQYLH